MILVRLPSLGCLHASMDFCWSRRLCLNEGMSDVSGEAQHKKPFYDALLQRESEEMSSVSAIALLIRRC